MLGKKGELEVEFPMLARGLPDRGEWSPWALKLPRGVDFW